MRKREGSWILTTLHIQLHRHKQLPLRRLLNARELGLDVVLDARRALVVFVLAVTVTVAVQLLSVLGEQVAKLAYAFRLPAFVARGENAAVARHDCSRRLRRVLISAWDAPLFFSLEETQSIVSCCALRRYRRMMSAPKMV